MRNFVRNPAFFQLLFAKSTAFVEYVKNRWKMIRERAEGNSVKIRKLFPITHFFQQRKSRDLGWKKERGIGYRHSYRTMSR